MPKYLTKVGGRLASAKQNDRGSFGLGLCISRSGQLVVSLFAALEWIGA